MSQPRLIKKYPNRRLYDTEISKYVTLDDIKKLVTDGVEFQVKDAKSEDDITRNILLQIIAEQEEGGQPIFNTESLMKIIRFYDDAMQNVASDFMSQSLNMFVETQHKFQEKFKETVTRNPVNAISELAKQNVSLWQEMQESFLKAAQPFGTPDKSADDKKS
jgi:polyhydroxyalkanoate synthesis repressor PhaR